MLQRVITSSLETNEKLEKYQQRTKNNEWNQIKTEK